MKHLCLAILGPTASGKSAFALQLAQELGGEIVCLDSTTLYRGFDVGSSKPSKEDRAKIPHHMLDILEPTEPFSAHHFVELADKKIDDIVSRKKLPIVVGGTYFYLRALQNGMYPIPAIPQDVIDAVEADFSDADGELDTRKMHQALKEKDPESAKIIHENDQYRLVRALGTIRTGVIPSQLKAAPLTPSQSSRLWMKYALTQSRHTLGQAIQRRTDEMLTQGLVAETKGLLEKSPSAKALQSIGYRETVRFLSGQITEKQLKNEIIEKTRQLAKRQITWLRSDYEVRYVDLRDKERISKEVENLRFVLNET